MSKAEDDFAQAKKISPLSLGQHTAPLSLWQRLMPWPSLVCLVILSAAAFLHWQRSWHTGVCWHWQLVLLGRWESLSHYSY